MSTLAGAEGALAAEPEGDVLLERTSQTQATADALDAARAGAGAFVVLEGAAGMGKTRLVRDAVERARHGGLRVGRAVGSELERSFPFGVARQLFEPLVAALPQADQDELLRGAARLAAPIVAPERAGEPIGSSQAPVLHGLYWVAVELCQRSPLLLVVDDAQWADDPSLQALAYLAHRIEGMPLALLVATRGGETTRPLVAQQSARHLTLAPLSEAAVTALARARLGSAVDDEFGAVCAEATGGNPFYLGELLNELAREGVRGEAAETPRVADVGPETVARAVDRLLACVSQPARRLAQAIAVLGERAELADAVELARVDRAEGAAAANELAEADVLRPATPLEFRHPIVRGAVYASVPALRRAPMHERAAAILRERGAPPERVAVHLRESEPAGDPQAVTVLHRAAIGAIEKGAPASAAEFLRRALREPPPPHARGELLTLLGTAELESGHPDAAEHLRAALELTEDQSSRVDVAGRLARALGLCGRTADAAQVIEAELAHAGGGDTEVRLALLAEEMTLLSVDPQLRTRYENRVAEARELTATREGPAARRLLASVAAIVADGGGNTEEVMELALRAQADGWLLADESAASPAFQLTVLVTIFTDRLEVSEKAIEAAFADARERGSELAFAFNSALRARVLFAAGRLEESEADARRALDFFAQHGMWHIQTFATIFLVDALLELGREREAAAELDRTLSGAPPGGEASAPYIVGARARVAARAGRLDEALEHALAFGRAHDAAGATNPAALVLPWRSEAALILHTLGRDDEAQALARDELERAAAFGAPRAWARALRAAAHVGNVASQVDACAQAVGLLEPTPCRLELAYALHDLGRANAAAGDRESARAVLRRSLDIAHDCSAGYLAERAREALIAAGGRPRRVRTTGRDSLTASERRVAELAAAGATNAEIAQALFVTLRAVEQHLTRTYRKLGVRSRSDLPGALDGAQVSASTE